LEAPGFEDCYPLFVPAPADQKADVLFLFSTNTYLAYANDRLAAMEDVLGQVMSHELVLPADEKYLHEHDELGRSCYDTHSDGTPVRYSSRRRPIINVRPGFPNWLTGSYRHFPADLYTMEWIARSGLSFHIATDEEVETDGHSLFQRYKTIVTSSHPEYWTLKGLDALQEYLTHGGRIMYLGGNGFYWVTSVDPERPWLIEVRRDNSGTRCWNAPPGERTHLYDGVPGGLWRWRGRGPNTLLGVGFASEGWNVAQPFARQPASYSGTASVWFEGITEEVIGDKGHILGGVAGDEVDRFDVTLGSPEYAEILCTATGFANEYQLVIEDQLLAMPNQGGADREDVVRCDMVYFPIEGGGAVFSGSSIAYCGALAWNNFDNDLATITTRALRSFCTSLPKG
jgi:N,N-dimethylformamidase